MENINPILNELKEISPLVAAVGNQLSYAVPQGYFDGLSTQVLLRIAIEEKAGADPVLNISKENIYQAPDGYFDTLAGNILNRIKATASGDAKEELAFLSPLLGKLEKKMPFTMPEGYFTDFSDNIVAGVKAVDFVNEELENLSPVMSALKNKQVYEVPAGYFETVPAVILQKAREQQPAKIVSIGFRKKVMQYAAAAIVTGVVLFSGYKYANTGNTGHTTPVVASPADLAKVSDQDLESFLNNSNTVSLADIDNDADTSNTITVADAGTANPDDTKDLLADISDEELQQYVDQRPETPISN